MEKVMKYKGVILRENTLAGYLAGEGKYAVFLKNGMHIPFLTKKQFKNDVNGINPYTPAPYSWMLVDKKGNWVNIPENYNIENLRQYALENQITD